MSYQKSIIPSDTRSKHSLGGVARYTVLVDSMGVRSTTTAIMMMVQLDGD